MNFFKSVPVFLFELFDGFLRVSDCKNETHDGFLGTERDPHPETRLDSFVTAINIRKSAVQRPFPVFSQNVDNLH